MVPGTNDSTLCQSVLYSTVQSTTTFVIVNLALRKKSCQIAPQSEGALVASKSDMQKNQPTTTPAKNIE